MSKEQLEDHEAVPEQQAVRAFAGRFTDELVANFGEPELGDIVPVSDTTNLWFDRAGLEHFIKEIDAGRGETAPLPRLLQVHIYPIGDYDEWPQLENFIGEETTAQLRQLYDEAMAKPEVNLNGLGDEEISDALSADGCQSEFEAPPLDLRQIADIIVTGADLMRGHHG